MNIKVNIVCNIAKNSLCVPTGPYASICVIFFMHCNIFIYCKLPFHRTLQMQLYSTCTVMSLYHTDLRTFQFQTVLYTLVVSSCLQCYKLVDSSRQTIVNTATPIQTPNTLLPLQPMPLDYHHNRSLYHMQCLLVTA